MKQWDDVVYTMLVAKPFHQHINVADAIATSRFLASRARQCFGTCNAVFIPSFRNRIISLQVHCQPNRCQSTFLLKTELSYFKCAPSHLTIQFQVLTLYHFNHVRFTNANCFSMTLCDTLYNKTATNTFIKSTLQIAPKVIMQFSQNALNFQRLMVVWFANEKPSLLCKWWHSGK